MTLARVIEVPLVLAFGVLLVVGALLSERARTTVLSTSVLFMGAGIAFGNLGTGWLGVNSLSDLVGFAAEVALYTILFTDGTHLPASEIRRAWKLPGRALLLGLPLTLGVLAVAAYWVLGLGWAEAFLVAAVLSPTDPVLVRAILEHEAVPVRLRQLLSVESGLNDGLVLPVIVILLSIAGAPEPHPWVAVLDALGGVAVGIAIPVSVLGLERLRFFEVAPSYRPLLGIAIACTTFGVCRLTGTNEFLAAFAGGITVASTSRTCAASYFSIGDPLSEGVKLAALLVFGAALTLQLDWRAIVYTAIALLLARPIGLLLAFVGRTLPRKEWLVAAWFGPKGFASVLYGELVVKAAVPHAQYLENVIGLVIAVSVVAHSSSDSVIARQFRTDVADGPSAEAPP